MKKTQIDINLPLGKKVFFASDFHLGSPSYEQSRIREKRIINWIKDHQQEMGALFLLGDVFDYWFEYRHVVPKGFIRLFGKLAELTDSGIDVYFFCGNHDTWVRDYFQKELGLRVFSGNAYLHIQGKTFFVGHGDGLGPDDIGYKFIKHLFDAKISRIFFAWLHPWTGYKLASGFSKRSRQADQLKLNRESYEKKKNANLMAFMQSTLKSENIDYFIFAHRHWPMLKEIPYLNNEGKTKQTDQSASKTCQYLNTGDWIQYFSYGVFDGKDLKLDGVHTAKIF